MEPNKRYTQVVEKPFHISQAAMDISTGDNESCQVMVVVDGKNFLICTLQKNKQIQVPLDLYFKSGDSVSFLTNGNNSCKCNIHLTGYLDPEFDDLEEEEEEEEEVPELVPAKNKRKLNDSTEGISNKKAKQEKKKPAEDDDSSDEDRKDQLQKLLAGEDVDSDENDESYKINTSAEADSGEDESDDDEESEEEEEGAEDDDDDDDDDEENDSQADSSLDNSKQEPKIDTSNLSKSQKKRLKKKLAQQAKEKPQLNGVDKVKKGEPQKAKEDKKKPEKEPAEKKEKKSLSGGVNIEDTKVGAGAVAKPGKQVMVYYEGRLKSNNKMFDNCMKGPGFKFRLGAKEVISGWDVGINGMKVGGKRRIVCPPAMAYGAKGSPPVIPPNSTLVFDVELKNVK